MSIDEIFEINLNNGKLFFFFFLLGWIIYITMNNYTPALLNAQSKLRSTVKFSLHFSLNSFKP